MRTAGKDILVRHRRLLKVGARTIAFVAGRAVAGVFPGLFRLPIAV